MKKNLFIFFILFLYIGCSSNLQSPILIEGKENKELFSCSEKAKPKSLQFLEQQYRCTSEQ